MILNLEHHQADSASTRPAVVLIHGLFGSLGNLGMIARALAANYEVIQVDVRNHGHSAHVDQVSYDSMAQDVLDTLDHLNIDQFSVIGHSMGGKIAMTLANLAAQRLQKLVVLDMAPYAYPGRHHDLIFQALFAVQNAEISSRKQATEIMQQYISENMVIQFLLKSFHQGQWLFNVDALYQHYGQMLAWPEQPAWNNVALFIRGGRSHYVTEDVQVAAVMKQFPQAQIDTIDNAGHWLHAEQPAQVMAKIEAYLA